MELPLVSIITVNYNQSAVTRDLLISLRKIDYKNVEILVVDNGSPSDTPEKLKEEFPEIYLIISKENLGFAGGNNLGVAKSKGEYCLFINNDTEVEPDFLGPLVARFQANPKIGMVSPKIRFHHTPDTIQYAGYTPFQSITLRQHLIGFRQIDNGQFDKGGYTFAGHGAAMMVSSEVIRKVGPMAELFFLYYEEHDWCERIKRNGYLVYYEPKSLVWHKESISTGKESPLKAYYITRNRILFARRNLRALTKIMTVLYLFTLVPINFTIRYILNKQFKQLNAAWKGTFWHLGKFGNSVHSN
jgi:GT2 family glycosyltransferase